MRTKKEKKRNTENERKQRKRKKGRQEERNILGEIRNKVQIFFEVEEDFFDEVKDDGEIRQRAIRLMDLSLRRVHTGGYQPRGT